MFKTIRAMTLCSAFFFACGGQTAHTDGQQVDPVLAAADQQQEAAFADARKRLLEMYSPEEADRLIAAQKATLAGQQMEATRSPPDATRADLFDGPFTPPQVKAQCLNGGYEGKQCRPDLELRDGGFNMNYGFYCGAGWGPDGNYRSSLAYDRIDQCCLFHDTQCWSRPDDNDASRALRNAVHFIKCVEQVEPKSREEALAKFYIMNSLLRIGAELAEPFAWLFGRGYLFPADPCSRHTPLVSDTW